MRPVTDADWRCLWHSTAKTLGRHVYHRWDGGVPIMDRTTWILLRRLDRIRSRLEAEHEFMDDWWSEATLQYLLDA